MPRRCSTEHLVLCRSEDQIQPSLKWQPTQRFRDIEGQCLQRPLLRGPKAKLIFRVAESNVRQNISPPNILRTFYGPIDRDSAPTPQKGVCESRRAGRPSKLES